MPLFHDLPALRRDAAWDRQPAAAWANPLSDGVTVNEIKTLHRVIMELPANPDHMAGAAVPD
ncbi:hypothetical protein [Paraburkholderia heleia]|uniref:hypothetical protein n=1 Tax=Paraburkholderia heleia TaxID=634127 RepID=UPI002AB7DFFE|nr:hypothetical protein [Paraburkholderia heleia]